MQNLEVLLFVVLLVNIFVFLLIDGLLVCEELVVYILQLVFGNILLCGGLVGDDLKFGSIWVFYEGVFYNDSVLLMLISMLLLFCVFKIQYFVSEMERMVVIEVDVV